MAVGDVVSQASTSSFTFRPASGVTVCITRYLFKDGNSAIHGRGDINASTAIETDQK